MEKLFKHSDLPRLPVNYSVFPAYFETELPENFINLNAIREIEIKSLQTNKFFKNLPVKPISKITLPFINKSEECEQ